MSVVRTLIPIVLAALASSARPSQDPVPLDFRCDGMQVNSKPNRSLCKGNVVVRRPDLLLCCNVFEGRAADDWQWDSFTCVDDVRAKRGDELMWADQADFVVATDDLTLTGRPLLHRGKSLLTGERIVINIKSDRARIEKPRGHLGRDSDLQLSEIEPVPEGTPLPAVCPIPPSPPR